MKTYSLLGLFLSVLASAWAGDTRVLAEIYKTADRMEMIREPDKVEVCILTEKNKRIADSYLEGEYRTLSEASAALLGEKLTDDSSFEWDVRSACYPIYNARVKFYKNGHILMADFCFRCDIMELSFDGVSFSGGTFSPFNNLGFALIKELFPKDPVVRAIAKNKEEDEKTWLAIKKAEALARLKKRKTGIKEEAGRQTHVP